MLTEKNRLRINFLQDNEDFLRVYKRLVVAQVLTEEEFWSHLNFFKDCPSDTLQEFNLKQGLPNILFKYEKKSTGNSDIHFTEEDLDTLNRLYPEFKEKTLYESQESNKEPKKDKRIQFVEEQIKKCTELVGGYKDISIEDMYKSKAPIVTVSKEVKDAFKDAYYPDYSGNKGTGVYRSRAEAEMSSMDVINNEENKKLSAREIEEEEAKQEKLNGMVMRLNRHSKRLLCSMGIGQSTPPTESPEHNIKVPMMGKPVLKINKNPPPVDTEDPVLCQEKMLVAIKSLQEKNSLIPNMISLDNAEAAWKQLSTEAAIGNFAQFSDRDPTGKLIQASRFYIETQFLLRIFYSQYPPVQQKQREILNLLMPLLSDCKKRIQEYLARDNQIKMIYEQIMQLIDRAFDYMKCTKKPTLREL